MLRSRRTMSKNKTQTISVSTLVKKLLRVSNVLLFNDLPSYIYLTRFNIGDSTFCRQDANFRINYD